MERLHGLSRSLEHTDGEGSLKTRIPNHSAMKKILMIEVSPRGKNSASRSVADTLAARLTGIYPSARFMRRDLAAEHLPHLDEITLRAISTRDPAEAEKLKEVARTSDQLTGELLESDLLVMATPMWNFGIPSALKAWIDPVVRSGRTFRCSDGGVLGMPVTHSLSAPSSTSDRAVQAHPPSGTPRSPPHAAPLRYPGFA